MAVSADRDLAVGLFELFDNVSNSVKGFNAVNVLNVESFVFSD